MTRSHMPITAESDAVVFEELSTLSQEVDRPMAGMVASDPVYGDSVLPPMNEDHFTDFGTDAPYFRELRRRRQERRDYISLLPELIGDAVHSYCDTLVGFRPTYDLYDSEFSLDETETDLEWRLEMPLSDEQIARYTPAAQWAVKHCVWDIPPSAVPQTVPQIVQDMWFRRYLLHYASQQPREAMK